MRFVMLYTPDRSKDRSQHIPRTMAKVREMADGGRLLMAAGIAKRDKGAAQIRLDEGVASIEQPASGRSVLFDADGFTLIEASDIEDAARVAADFMQAAGDGVVQVAKLVDPVELP